MLQKKFFTFKKKKILILMSIILLSCIGLFQTDHSPDINFMHLDPLDDISCHYDNSEDSLQSTDDPGFFPPPKSIFFHETSCLGDLDSRQSCAVESAARAHKNWQVYVLFSSPINSSTLSNGRLKLLKGLKNVNYARVHLAKYVSGTVLEPLVLSGALNRSKYRVSHTSDVLRYVTLYKFGGMYLDLDVVVTRNLGLLVRNWAARESNVSVSAGVLSLSRDQLGRRVAEAALRDMNSNFRADLWGYLGPGVITRVLQNICSTKAPDAMSSATCGGFEVYGPQFFYPIEWARARVYFKKGHIYMPQAHMFHLWNKLTQQWKVDKDSPYAKLAKKYCPTTYKNNKQDFGFREDR